MGGGYGFTGGTSVLAAKVKDPKGGPKKPVVHSLLPKRSTVAAPTPVTLLLSPGTAGLKTTVPVTDKPAVGTTSKPIGGLGETDPDHTGIASPGSPGPHASSVIPLHS